MRKRIAAASLGATALFFTVSAAMATPAMAATPATQATPAMATVPAKNTTGLHCQYWSDNNTFGAGCRPGVKADIGSWFQARAQCKNGQWINGRQATLVANKTVWSYAYCTSVNSSYKKGTGRYDY